MIELFHISDLHLGKSEYQELCVKQLLENMMRRHGFTPDGDKYLIVTGDITNSGKNDQYFTALKMLKPFRNRIIVVPGNHDYGWLGSGYSEERARNFDSPFADSLGFQHAFFDKSPFDRVLEDTTDKSKVAIIGLNSCRCKGVLDLAKGEIGALQRAKLTEIMERYAGLPKIIFLHHIPYKDASSPWMMTLIDHKELMSILTGRYNALAFGHQGAMKDPEDPETFQRAAKRGMKLLVLRDPAGKEYYHLDANCSIEDQACYHITVKESTVSATLDKFPPRPPEPKVNLEPPSGIR